MRQEEGLKCWSTTYQITFIIWSVRAIRLLVLAKKTNLQVPNETLPLTSAFLFIWMWGTESMIFGMISWRLCKMLLDKKPIEHFDAHKLKTMATICSFFRKWIQTLLKTSLKEKCWLSTTAQKSDCLGTCLWNPDPPLITSKSKAFPDVQPTRQGGSKVNSAPNSHLQIQLVEPDHLV